MVRTKVELKFISDQSQRNSTYSRRIRGLKKKTYELSSLCAVPILLVSFGPQGQVDTWPESKQDIEERIDLLRHSFSNYKNKVNVAALLRSQIKKMKQDVDRVAMSSAGPWPESEQGLIELIASVDSKLREVKKRMQSHSNCVEILEEENHTNVCERMALGGSYLSYDDITENFGIEEETVATPENCQQNDMVSYNSEPFGEFHGEYYRGECSNFRESPSENFIENTNFGIEQDTVATLENCQQNVTSENFIENTTAENVVVEPISEIVPIEHDEYQNIRFGHPYGPGHWMNYYWRANTAMNPYFLFAPLPTGFAPPPPPMMLYGQYPDEVPEAHQPPPLAVAPPLPMGFLPFPMPLGMLPVNGNTTEGNDV